MQNGPWYSRTVCYQLSSKKIEYDFKTVRKDSYEWICDVDAYGRAHTSGTDDETVCGGRPLPSKSYIYALE